MILLSHGKKILIFLFFSIFFLSSRTTFISFKGVSAHEEFLLPAGFSPVWETVRKGIESFSYGNSYPPFYISALRINLTVPEREVVVSRGITRLEDDKAMKNNFYSGTVEQFIQTNDLVAAINATPFKPYRLSTGGFFIILKEGKNVAEESPRAARSLIGSSKGGRVILLVTIDGEDTRTGSGATFYESAEWMRALGAENAINMDGGGSSILAMKEIHGNGITILNHPEGGMWTFFKRNSPVFLGVR